MTDQPDSPPDDIAKGLATQLGITFTTGGFAAAVAAFIAGDHTQQTLGTIAGGAIGLVALLTTMIGRYRQANLKIIHSAQQAKPSTPPAVYGNIAAGQTTIWTPPQQASGGAQVVQGTPREVVRKPQFDPALEVPGGSVPTGREHEDGVFG